MTECVCITKTFSRATIPLVCPTGLKGHSKKVRIICKCNGSNVGQESRNSESNHLMAQMPKCTHGSHFCSINSVVEHPPTQHKEKSYNKKFTKAMFSCRKVLRKKILKIIVFSYLVSLLKVPKKMKYN